MHICLLHITFSVCPVDTCVPCQTAAGRPLVSLDPNPSWHLALSLPPTLLAHGRLRQALLHVPLVPPSCKPHAPLMQASAGTQTLRSTKGAFAADSFAFQRAGMPHYGIMPVHHYGSLCLGHTSTCLAHAWEPNTNVDRPHVLCRGSQGSSCGVCHASLAVLG